ncbi:hypothetical protein G4B88_019345 [Cannabis sativa]|uniref:RING-type E3 ubiquitin transferase n=1 Tax=Cannabis sativa TaxID=3483 RepID=A0A7J6DYK3_CANSA|nr:hypothetical protein G4B88_019345 [Cannabis sativa]
MANVDDSDQSDGSEISTNRNDPILHFLLIVIVIVAFTVSIYRLIIAIRRLRHRPQIRGSTLPNSRVPAQSESTQGPVDHDHQPPTVIELVPSLENEKNGSRGLELLSVRQNDIVFEKAGEGRMVGNDANVCAVCLSEFAEEEELRILPECLHSFHKSCVDTWLFSHSTCPICRTKTALLSPLPPEIGRYRTEENDQRI